VLLIDEALAAGDDEFKLKAMQMMTEKLRSDLTFVFVSHSLPQVSKLCRRGIWLDQGRIRAEGDVETITNEYKAFQRKKNQGRATAQQLKALR